MKIIVLTLTAAHIVLAQPTLQKTWVGKNNDFLRIGKDTIEICTGFFVYQMPYSLAGDTIKLPMEYSQSPGGEPDDNVHLYRVTYLTEHSLILVDEFGSDTNPGKPYQSRYVDSAVTYDKDFRFDSLYFAATECYLGNARACQLAISSNGAVRFEGRAYTQAFHGCYTGNTPQELDSEPS